MMLRTVWLVNPELPAIGLAAHEATQAGLAGDAAVAADPEPVRDAKALPAAGTTATRPARSAVPPSAAASRRVAGRNEDIDFTVVPSLEFRVPGGKPPLRFIA
jgi:hypothetical protein